MPGNKLDTNNKIGIVVIGRNEATRLPRALDSALAETMAKATLYAPDCGLQEIAVAQGFLAHELRWRCGPDTHPVPGAVSR